MSQLVELDPLLVKPLKRPEAPPKKRPAPSTLQARPVVLKTAFGIVAGVALLAFAGRVARFAVEPVLATYRTGQEIRHLQVVSAREADVNSQLREDIAYLKTPAGIEQEARRRGWVKPGEIAISVVVPPEADEPGGAKKMPGKKARPAVADRIRGAVDTCLAVFGGRPRGK